MRLYLILAALLTLAAGGAWFYHQGEMKVQGQQTEKALQEKERQEQLVAKLQQENDSRQRYYEQKIQSLEKIHDSCLDSKLPDDLLRLLRDNDNGSHK